MSEVKVIQLNDLELRHLSELNQQMDVIKLQLGAAIKMTMASRGVASFKIENISGNTISYTET
jgi:hypothetical protein